MTLPSISLLRQVLRKERGPASLSLSEWDLLIRQGRSAHLLGQIAAACGPALNSTNFPSHPKWHIESALNLAKRQRLELLWEVEQIRLALEPGRFEFILLKGSAYVMAGLSAANGWLVSDVDILVSKADLAGVESALIRRGWVSAAKSAYDQKYYRTWMHEIPPMRHFKRGTVIDVHHAILPLTATLYPNPTKLFAHAKLLSGQTRMKVLSPVDMVLHSACHLFHESDYAQGLRGLFDIDRLLSEFGQHEEFWPALAPRAIELQLARPALYALRYTSMLFGTHASIRACEQLTTALGGHKLGLATKLMDSLFLRALRPIHSSTTDRWTPLARWLLYIRGHWLRMPPWMLLRHLVRKLVIPDKSA